MRYLPSLSSTFIVLLLLTALGCEQIDDLAGGGIDKPSVTYSSTSFEADFFESGSSSSPSIDWNGEQGTVTLGTTLAGLRINSTTGKLEWTKMLPPGTHDVDVVVANSEGQVVVPVTITNPLAGTFDGTYAGAYDYTLEFDPSGGLIARADGETATGSWEIIDSELIAYYAYDAYPDIDYSLRADIEQTNSEATISGEYYNGTYTSGSTPVEEFAVSLQ